MSPMLSPGDTLSMPQASHATSPGCRIQQRPLLLPQLSTSCSTFDTGQVAYQKICHGGKVHQPRIGARKALCWDHQGRPLRSHEDRSSFLELPFERTSKCACCIGLHYATRAAPPDPLLHHQEHDRLWHVRTGSSGLKEASALFPQINMAQVPRCPRIGCKCPLEPCRGKIWRSTV